MQTEIKIWDRKQKSEIIEKIYGEKPMRLLYGNSLGQLLTNSLLSKACISNLYGKLQSSSWSKKKVKPFIQDFSIPMEEYEDREFHSFNDFFTRKFRENQRSFPTLEKEMGAIAEGRYFAIPKLEAEEKFPIKGFMLSIEQLLQKPEWITRFAGGPCVIARLCPTDYHRYHYPDQGMLLEQYTESGPLHSVNPLVLKIRPDVLFTNERQVSILETQNFGLLAYIEVGALCVGRIVQSHKNTNFLRGEEKGYFLFGGSTVILLGQANRWQIDADIVEESSQQRECLLRLGEKFATAL